MKQDTLKQILLDKINATEGYITKGELGLVAEQNGYLPEGAGRVLRSLAERRPDHEPEIEVAYYKGKRNQLLSRYARLNTPKPIIKKPRIIIRDGEILATID